MSIYKQFMLIIVTIISALRGLIMLPANMTPCRLEKRMDIQLPKSAVIEKYERDIIGYNMYIKLSADKNDMDKIKSVLIDYCKKNNYRSDDYIPDLAKVAWWDIDRKGVELAYSGTTKGNWNSTRNIYAFMAKGADGNQYFWLVL